MNLQLAKASLAEAIGTFALTFVASAALCTDVYSGGEVGLLGVALAQGLLLAAVVATLGRVSGAHINPAVTVGAVLVGAVGPVRAALYVAAQLLGAVVAGLMVAAIFAADVWEPVQLGTPLLGPGVAAGTGVFVEAVLTFMLVFTVLGVTRAGRESDFGAAGTMIGAVFAVGVIVAGPLTGGALNPARAFGPALASGHWQAQQVYWLGPLLGAVFGAVGHGLTDHWWREPASDHDLSIDEDPDAEDRPAVPEEDETE